MMMLKGSLLIVIYGVSLVFYLLSWETVGPDGIEQRLPWGTLKHRFQDVASLEMVDSPRSDPSYVITLQSGRAIKFGTENEGTTPDEARAISSFVAQRSGRAWVRREASPRR